MHYPKITIEIIFFANFHEIKLAHTGHQTYKATVHLVNWIFLPNICWKCTPFQAIQDVDEFVSSSDLEKSSIYDGLVQQWMLCSEWVPSERESKQLIKTSQ